jgi:hypothetical protein
MKKKEKNVEAGELRLMIKERQYEHIFLETNKNIWSEIYIDSFGIEKSKFISKLYHEWQIYLEFKSKSVSKERFNELKEESWRELSLLAMVYDDCNPIEFSYEINDMVLYPICVITMLSIFDLDCCIEEYLEFSELEEI